MPKNVAFDMYKGYMDKMRNDTEKVSEILKTTAQLPVAAPAPVPPAQQQPAGGMQPMNMAVRGM